MAKKNAPAKTEIAKVTPEPKVKKLTVRGLIVGKILEGTLTDSAILDLVIESFPGWTLEGKKHYVSWYRWDLGRKGIKDVPAAVKEVKAAKAEAAA
jgi:hypothetical protein